MSSRRQSTIKYIVPNLRARWEKELEPYSDDAIAEVYEEYELSEDFGNNGEKFPEWFDMLSVSDG